MKSARERASEAFDVSQVSRADFVLVVAEMFKEHARDQRHLCADSVRNAFALPTNDPHALAMNAPAPGEGAMSEILAWRCEDREFNCWLTDDGSDVESARLAGCRVTPLVAAPPEGAPTWDDATEAVDLVRLALNGNQWNEWHRRARALLSRIPKDTA